MHPALLLGILAVAHADEPPPAPRSVVVWAEAELPPPEVRRRAERLTGPSEHRAWREIAFEAQPFGDPDTAARTALNDAVASGRRRWDAFDVEAAIATELHTACAGVELVRDPGDREALLQGLLLEAAAALRIVPESRFEAADEVAALRRKVVTTSAPSALVDALALEPGRLWERADVPDGQTFLRLQALQTELRAAPRARLAIDALPLGAIVSVDGRQLPAGSAEVELEPGHHYVHALVAGRIGGRVELDVSPGDSLRYGPLVSRGELDQARTKILAGSAEVPEDFARTGVRGALPHYLAALDEKGDPELVPWNNGAAIDRRSPVTVILVGVMGGGVLVSPAFQNHVDEVRTALAFGGDLGFELGIYNFVINGGTTLLVTPQERMAYSRDPASDDVETNAFFRPYGGVGVYLPRPRSGTPLMMVGGNYGWLSPGAMGFGARLSFGIPLRGEGTWLRLDLDGFRGTEMAGFPAEGQSTYIGALRLGFGRLL